MSNIKELEANIREVLPELQDITHGLMINYVGDELMMIRVNSYDEYECMNMEDPTEDLVCVPSIHDADEEDLKIIGHDIQLHHVLECFKLEHNRIAFSNYDELVGYIVRSWQMMKPFKYQREQLINYLHSLIK